MKILVSGDKHLGLVSDGMSRLEEQRRVLAEVVRVLNAEAPDVFVDLGDLFHSPRPGPDAYEVAFEYVRNVAEWARPHGSVAYFLVGNHDKTTRGRVHALTPMKMAFRGNPTIEVVDLPCTRLDSIYSPKLCLVFLPHVTDWEAREFSGGACSAREYLREASKNQLKFAERETIPVVAFTHLGVEGSRIGAGDSVQRDTGLCIPEELLASKSLLHVYAGHVHGYQTVGKKVTVVGSAIYVDFGEAADRKGMILAKTGDF